MSGDDEAANLYSAADTLAGEKGGKYRAGRKRTKPTKKPLPEGWRPAQGNKGRGAPDSARPLPNAPSSPYCRADFSISLLFVGSSVRSAARSRSGFRPCGNTSQAKFLVAGRM
jgi:hypothetical protein